MSNYKIIDSHCHLNYLKLNGDLNLDDVISNATKNNIEKIITISVAWKEIEEIKAIAEKYKQVFFSAGVHPSEFSDDFPSLESLVETAKHKKCVAIGETGLDYHYNNESTHQDQKERFIQHIHAGITIKKPLVVHTRNAKKDTLEILKSEHIEKCGGVLHCFTEDWDMAKSALDMGMYISFSGIVTFKNAQDIQDVAKKVPIDRVLIETDSPYLAPIPYRGKPNFPEYVRCVGEYIANLRGMNMCDFAKQTYDNTTKLFNL